MSVGFKEWTLVCDALGRGEQSLIIRKGGIAEGRAGFRFEHAEFFLLPTLFHEQVAKLRLPAGVTLPQPPEDGSHRVSLRARVEWTRDLQDWGKICRLEPFHCWQRSEIEKRFHYEAEKGKTGVSVALVRIEKLAAPWVFPDAPRYGGCRSWVQLPDAPSDLSALPVLEDAAHQAREAEILHVLES